MKCAGTGHLSLAVYRIILLSGRNCFSLVVTKVVTCLWGRVCGFPVSTQLPRSCPAALFHLSCSQRSAEWCSLDKAAHENHLVSFLKKKSSLSGWVFPGVEHRSLCFCQALQELPVLHSRFKNTGQVHVFIFCAFLQWTVAVFSSHIGSFFSRSCYLRSHPL